MATQGMCDICLVGDLRECALSYKDRTLKNNLYLYFFGLGQKLQEIKSDDSGFTHS